MRKLWLVPIIILGMMLVNNTYSEFYLAKLKSDSIPVSMHENGLLREIEIKASSFETNASDARIDPVWKAIPGYNGLKVNIKESYQRMKKDGEFSEDKLVLEQTSPKVHLSELPPSPVYKGHPDKPMVAFVINVAWGNEYLSEMLATLKKHRMKASFFMEGRWVKNNPKLAKMIAEEGHEIGNHSFSHPKMEKLSGAEANEEISKTNAIIETTTGVQVKWFSPPSGGYRDETVKIAAANGLGTIMWSVDTIDWQKPTSDTLIRRVTTKVHNGAIILMHPTKSTADSLDRLIEELNKRELHVGTISELLSEDRVMKKMSKK
ncbi:polysaccharide deacetylase family protein [Bacillus massilinigeriensis]|uniref:polysaccharide deacetylase family protein n=1 Tax=Bacillus mediterraneensis TaxID=1805474 RepID=UPI0008F94422|nr:polysaccharide deacetylase family protein [Bacillus mediterraneensis]